MLEGGEAACATDSCAAGCGSPLFGGGSSISMDVHDDLLLEDAGGATNGGCATASMDLKNLSMGVRSSCS